MSQGWLSLAPEVARTLGAGGPVVALESAVLSHGLPPEETRALAERIDALVREAGATPALVALRNGRVDVGVRPAETAFLLSQEVMKVAERDLAVAVGTHRSGGTTVSATLAAASAAGIKVMSTGGIGGVHLGEGTGDVSADLGALSRYPVVVVCSGAKAICDMRRTAEMLDSLAVTVLGFQTGSMPAFLARSSRVALPHRAESAGEIASIAEAKLGIGGRTALLVVQQPPEDAALEEDVQDRAVAGAIARAHAAGVGGAALTPYLLSALLEATGGRSLRSNLALLEANARLAAEIARELAQRRASPYR